MYLSVVDQDLEEGVHQQNSVWQDAAAVQQNRLKHTVPSIANPSAIIINNLTLSNVN